MATGNLKETPKWTLRFDRNRETSLPSGRPINGHRPLETHRYPPSVRGKESGISQYRKFLRTRHPAPDIRSCCKRMFPQRNLRLRPKCCKQGTRGTWVIHLKNPLVCSWLWREPGKPLLCHGLSLEVKRTGSGFHQQAVDLCMGVAH